MSLYEFIALTSDQQLAIVWEQGQFVALRDEAGQRAGLYTLGWVHSLLRSSTILR